MLSNIAYADYVSELRDGSRTIGGLTPKRTGKQRGNKAGATGVGRSFGTTH
jgi:hypothetical protein